MSATVVPAPGELDPQANLRNEHKVMTPVLPQYQESLLHKLQSPIFV